MHPNVVLADLPGMDKKKPVDLANEPVDLDEDGPIDTGILHGDEEDEDGRADTTGRR